MTFDTEEQPKNAGGNGSRDVEALSLFGLWILHLQHSQVQCDSHWSGGRGRIPMASVCRRCCCSQPGPLLNPALLVQENIFPLIIYAILKFVRKKCWFPLLFLFLLVLIFLGGFDPAQASPNPQATIVKSIFVQSPREGQALQGVEIIEGKIRGEGFLRGTIHFSYSDTPAQDRTWFFIAAIDAENQDSSQAAFLVEWDTTQITDGNYDLRLVAEYSGEAAIFELVPNLRIRNHTPVETATSAPVIQGDGDQTPSAPSPTSLPESTPTPLPPNPAEVRAADLQQVMLVSGIAVAGIFFVGMIYWYLYSKTR